jgi:hypothetical protein
LTAARAVGALRHDAFETLPLGLGEEFRANPLYDER